MAIVARLSAAGFERFVGDKIDFLIPPEKSFSLMLNLSGEQFSVFASILGALCKALGERGCESHNVTPSLPALKRRCGLHLPMLARSYTGNTKKCGERARSWQLPDA